MTWSGSVIPHAELLDGINGCRSGVEIVAFLELARRRITRKPDCFCAYCQNLEGNPLLVFERALVQRHTPHRSLFPATQDIHSGDQLAQNARYRTDSTSTSECVVDLHLSPISQRIAGYSLKEVSDYQTQSSQTASTVASQSITARSANTYASNDLIWNSHSTIRQRRTYAIPKLETYRNNQGQIVYVERDATLLTSPREPVIIAPTERTDTNTQKPQIKSNKLDISREGQLAILAEAQLKLKEKKTRQRQQAERDAAEEKERLQSRASVIQTGRTDKVLDAKVKAEQQKRSQLRQLAAKTAMPHLAGNLLDPPP